MDEERIGRFGRKTKETNVDVELNLDGTGIIHIDSNVPFLDHMLTLFAVHGLFDLRCEARGDVQVDDHHTVEDVGICLGQAFKEAIGDKEGIVRFGTALVPMDESLVNVVCDISGRGFLMYSVEISCEKIGNFDTELLEEFFRAFATNAGITLHVRKISGKNGHHTAEALFKGLGRSIRQASEFDDRMEGIPSSKGSL